MTTAILFDTIIKENGLKNDAAISRITGIKSPTISKLRYGKLPLGATVIIRLHEAFPIEVKRIKELAGVKIMAKYVPE